MTEDEELEELVSFLSSVNTNLESCDDEEVYTATKRYLEILEKKEAEKD